jgi:hypothetical protein
VRSGEPCHAVITVIARVRDEVLYTFAAPSTPFRHCQTLVLPYMRQVPCSLRCPLAGTLLLAAAWPLVRTREDPVADPRLRHWVHSTATWPLSGARRRHPLRRHLANTRVDLVAAPLSVLILHDLRCAGCPLLGPSPVLIVVFVSMTPLTLVRN